MGPGGLATPNRAGVCGRPPTNRPLLAVREDGGVYSPSLRSRAVRLPPTPCRVCFRPCVFNLSQAPSRAGGDETTCTARQGVEELR
jgi:hypothetical protein